MTVRQLWVPGAGTAKGSATKVPQVIYDPFGRIISVTEVTISGAGLDTTAIHSADAAGGDLGGTYPNPTVQQGEFGYVETTTAQGTITTVVDLTSLTLTKTLVNGRNYLWMLKCQLQSTVANDTMQIQITDTTPTTLALANINSSVITTNYTVVAWYREAGTGASVTRKGRVLRAAGTGTLTSQAGGTNKAFLMCIDLGTV